MKALSLFSGIGGLDLAAEACGIETVAMCEIEPFPVSILQKRWPGVPIYDDVRKIKGSEIIERLGAIDVVHGGFPCQDLSDAGRKAGLIDSEGNVTRSGLWFEMLRIISECRPRFIVAENVRGAIRLALDTVKNSLEREGYSVRAIVIPASAFGAPHQRERIFIVGVRRDVADACWTGLQGYEFGRGDSQKARRTITKCREDGRINFWRTPDANAQRGAMSESLFQRRVKTGKPININAQVAHEERQKSDATGGQLNPAWVEQLMGYPDGWTDPDCDEPTPWLGWPARPGEPQYPYEHPRTVTGMKNKAKRLKALGNSVVPQQAEPIFRTIQFIDYMIGEEHGIYSV